MIQIDEKKLLGLRLLAVRDDTLTESEQIGTLLGLKEGGKPDVNVLAAKAGPGKPGRPILEAKEGQSKPPSPALQAKESEGKPPSPVL
ncbi:MAG: hypothetical protein ACE363_01735 [Alphaproteobacteria bacterium]